MDTLEFFQAVLPQQGLKCLAEFAPGRKPKHTFYETHEAAALAAVSIDTGGRTVYHACASFLTDENRKQDNAGWMRSFWVDADVEPGNPEKYGSLKEAVVDIGRACKELGLPLPLIVKSGMGAHAYWVLDADIEAREWVLVAGRFKSALERIGFRQDRTRTADSASVLRPVGTHWRKSGVRPVGCLHQGSAISFDFFASRVGGQEAHPGAAGRGDGRLDGDLCDDLGGPREFPPASAEAIRLQCATLAHVADQLGNVEEPLWRAMLGLVKFTTEGASLGQEWSSGHPDYDTAQTSSKIEFWTAGPTTCAHFRGTNGNRCVGCPHTVTSPIHLGYTEVAPAPALAIDGADVVPEGEAEAAEPEAIPHWPKREFFWNGQSLCKSVKDEDGLISWVPFCDSLFFPVRRVRDEEGTWSLEIHHRGSDDEWKDPFLLPTELIGSYQGISGALASHEIFIYGRVGVDYIKAYLRNYTLSLQQHGVQQLTYKKLGWADEFKGFVLGDRVITQDSELNIIPGEFIKGAEWGKDFGTSGSLEEWVRLIDVIYNRPSAEPYQFTIGCALAAPLVEITDVDNWHGIPVALTGDTSLGKTTTCKVATSIYGHPENLMISAGKNGATMNGMISKIGTARHLPLIYDELSDRDNEEISSMLFQLSTGKPKIRLRADGSIINLDLSWKTISFMTSNKNVTELLRLLEKQAVTEATQLRVFEIALEKDITQKIWGRTNAVDLIEHQLMENYGHAGRVWLRYIMANREVLKADIRKMRAKYNSNDSDETRERYYRDLVATVTIALKHAFKIGLVKFDVAAVLKWARQNTVKLRGRRSEHTMPAEEYIAHFLGSLVGRTILTKKLGDGRAGGIEAVLDPVRGNPAARMATDDKVLLVLKKAMFDWCTEMDLQPSFLLDEMMKQGYIKGGEKRERLGRGTNIPSTPAAIYELEFDKAFGAVK